MAPVLEPVVHSKNSASLYYQRLMSIAIMRAKATIIHFSSRQWRENGYSEYDFAADSGIPPNRLLKITVLGIQGAQVKLGFEADADVPVHRSEVWEKNQREQASKQSN